MQWDFEVIDEPRCTRPAPGSGGKAGLQAHGPFRALERHPSGHSSEGFINQVSLQDIRKNQGR